MKPVIITKALEEACEILGVKLPVRFRWQSNLRCYGVHHVVPNSHHRLTIRSTLCRKEMNLTIWHELTHAAQWDRYGHLMNKIYNIDMKRLGMPPNKTFATPDYRSIPLEAEAYFNEERYGHRWLIK